MKTAIELESMHAKTLKIINVFEIIHKIYVSIVA